MADHLSCPHCGVLLSDSEFRTLRARWNALQRYTRAGGHNGGRRSRPAGPAPEPAERIYDPEPTPPLERTYTYEPEPAVASFTRPARRQPSSYKAPRRPGLPQTRAPRAETDADTRHIVPID